MAVYVHNMYVRVRQALTAAVHEPKRNTGRAIFASGSPFEPVTIHGKTFKPSQCNNMYVRSYIHHGFDGAHISASNQSSLTPPPIYQSTRFVFPGLGLGAVVSGAAIITDKMLYASSEALAASLTDEERAEGRVFPRVRRIREVALKVVRLVVSMLVLCLFEVPWYAIHDPIQF